MRSAKILLRLRMSLLARKRELMDDLEGQSNQRKTDIYYKIEGELNCIDWVLNKITLIDHDEAKKAQS